MRTALFTEQCPFDADLEKVIPGLNQRLHVNHAAIIDLGNRIDHMDTMIDNRFSQIDNRFSQIDNRLSQIERSLHERSQVANVSPLNNRMLEDLLQVICNHLQNSSGHEATFPTPARGDHRATFPPPQPVRRDVAGSNAYQLLQHSQQRASSTDLPDVPPENYRWQYDQLDLSDVWDQWFGLGRFADGYGGIEGRDKDYKTRWRKHLNAKEHSRLSQIVYGIIAYGKDNSIEPEDVIVLWTPLYEGCGNKISNFVFLLQERSMIKKCAKRGRAASVRTARNASETASDATGT
jgi:hypothetical protein